MSIRKFQIIINIEVDEEGQKLLAMDDERCDPLVSLALVIHECEMPSGVLVSSVHHVEETTE